MALETPAADSDIMAAYVAKHLLGGRARIPWAFNFPVEIAGNPTSLLFRLETQGIGVFDCESVQMPNGWFSGHAGRRPCWADG